MIKTLKRWMRHDHPVRLQWHKAKAFCAALRYGFPARNLSIIGITGTDGKTTTVGMLAHILHEEGMQVAALSTAFFRIGEKVTWNATQKTSPSPFRIQQFLRQAKKHGCTHVVLESSSHGLHQHRLDYTWPNTAGITNLSAEHLDYHGTMSDYLDAKAILFRMLEKDGTKVLNADDPSYADLKKIKTEHTILFSQRDNVQTDGNPLLRLRDIETTPTSSKASIHIHPSTIRPRAHGREAGSGSSDEGDADLHCPLALKLPGAFNLSNALCAIGCAMSQGVRADKAAAALQHFTGMPGRMEPIDEGQNFSVIVDFTVTPASYEATLSSLKSALPEGKKLIVVMGSCGDRMKEKRPLIAKIASRLADSIIVTNEDPYTEDPQKVIDDVWAGIDQEQVHAKQILNRTAAIRDALSQAQDDDIVLLCGKGSDTTMFTANGQIPWNEREIVREMLKNYSK